MNDTSNNFKGVVEELEEYLTTVILGGVCYITEKVSEVYVVQEMYVNILFSLLPCFPGQKSFFLSLPSPLSVHT